MNCLTGRQFLIPQIVCRGGFTRLTSLRGWSAPAHAPISCRDCRGIAVRATAIAEAGNAQQQFEHVSTTAFGKVMQAQANFVRVRIDLVEGGGEPPQPQLLCVVRSLLKKIKQTVLVGDNVEVIGIDWTDGRGMVQEVVDRRNALTDPAIANIDQALLVFSLAQPPFEPANATRFMVTAEHAGIPLTLVLNKADLLPPEELEAVVSKVKSWGYTPITVSARSGRGLQPLLETLIGKVSVLAGPSGVGKSSLLNALKSTAIPDNAAMSQDGELQTECATADSDSSDEDAAPNEAAHLLGDEIEELQAVGGVSAIGRGKHTTRTVTLLQMRSGGYIADTPGFNQPALETITSEQLPSCFPEIGSILENSSCRFSNCQHKFEPGCAVRGDWERYPFFREIQAEVETREERDRARSISKRQREGNTRIKSTGGGRTKKEALLNSKSHRKQSRKRTNQTMQQKVDEELDEAYDEEEE